MRYGLGLALLLNTKVRFMSIYRTVFFVPSLVPAVASESDGSKSVVE